MPTTLEKKANHQVNIVRLGAPRVHANADTLELFDIGGYQVVTKKGNFKQGDLAVYIQPDSVVPLTPAFAFLEGRTRITVRRFRKEWSEGLLMPLTDFPELITKNTDEVLMNVMIQGDAAFEGQDVSELLGITHYITADDVVSTASGNAGNKDIPHRRYPKTLRGWFYFLLHKIGFRNRQYNEEITYSVPGFDVENFKNFKNTILAGEEVIVTEKIHGSQAKYVFVDGKMFAGSRNFWKAEKSPCVWRKALAQNPWIEKFCRAHEGYVLYGEVVPTQKGFNYGCENGEVKFFVFDIRNSAGNYVGKSYLFGTAEYHGITTVPVLYEGPFAYDTVQLADGKSEVPGANHIREGAVVTVLDPARWARGLGRIQLKIVSNAFLEKDSK